MLLKYLDPFIITLAFIFEPVFALILSTWFGLDNFQLISFVIFTTVIVLSNLLCVLGIRQFEDKYAGGILGVTKEERNNIRIEHLKELQFIGVDDKSELGSKG